jgi:hypothetical protein
MIDIKCLHGLVYLWYNDRLVLTTKSLWYAINMGKALERKGV